MLQATRRMLIAALLVAVATVTPPTADAMITERHSPALSMSRAARLSHRCASSEPHRAGSTGATLDRRRYHSRVDGRRDGAARRSAQDAHRSPDGADWIASSDRRPVMRRIGLAGAVMVAALAMLTGTAWAEASTTLCVPEKAGKPIVTGTSEGKCTKAKYSAVMLPAGGLEALGRLLPHMKYLETGVAGKPTIQFSGVNVQVVNGEGETRTANGEGNLVIGYDENKGGHEQTGSHDLIVGEEQTFTSYGGVVAGLKNSITGPFASVTAEA